MKMPVLSGRLLFFKEKVRNFKVNYAIERFKHRGKRCFPVSDVIRPSPPARLIYHGPAWSREDDRVVFGQKRCPDDTKIPINSYVLNQEKP